MHNIDFIFINWNSADLLFQAIQSIEHPQASASIRKHPQASASIRKHPQASASIIIVDNGSSDDSCQRIRAKLPQAQLIEMGYNSGFATAVNAGLQHATHRYALILNTDIEFKNNVADILVNTLQSHAAALACPELHRPNGTLQAAVVPEPTLLTELTNRSIARRMMSHNLSQTIEVKSIVGPCMAVDIEQLQQLGLGENGQFFDQRFFFFFEETDFCRRIIQAGGKIVYQPQAKLMHLQGESANKRPVRARIQFQQSRYRYFAKHYGAYAIVLLFIGTLFRTLFNAIAQSLMTIISLGKSDKARNKAYVYWAITLWHLLLCRPRWGLDQRTRAQQKCRSDS